MKLTIKMPQIITEASKQTENLDYVFPASEEGSADNRLFILCDGIGPSRRGNNAAQLIGNCFYEYITKINPPKQRIGQVYMNDVLRYAERKLWNEIKEHSGKQGIGSSILLIYINSDDTISIGWVGNIRAYHVRDKQIIYETEDHLTVLRENGRNIAVEPRVILGVEPAWASVTIITDIQTSDYFLICTQGVYETFDHRNIKYLLSQGDGSDSTNKAIADKMRELCLQNWDDDFSLILIRIKEGTTVPASLSNTINAGNISTNNAQGGLHLDNLPSGIIKKKDKKKLASNKRPLFSGGGGSSNPATPARAGIILLLIFLAIGTAFAYKYFISKPEDVFNNYLTKADELLKTGDFENAIAQYNNALNIKLPDTSAFPLIRAKIAEANLSMLEKQAENLFNAQNWVKAKGKYEEILKLHPDDSLVIQQIDVLLQTINNEKLKLMAKADTLLNLKDYASAKQLLYEALYYDQTNAKILEQINLCNLFLNAGTVSLSDAVSTALRMDSLGEFKANRLSLHTANQTDNSVVVEPLDIYEQEPNPQNIYTTTSPIGTDNTSAKFNELVKLGDEAMQAADFETAKSKYTEALSQKRSPEIEAKLSNVEQALYTKKYQEIISLADNAFNKGNYENARNYYLDALKYKANDEYAGLRADECSDKLSSANNASQAKIEKYNRLVEEANAAFNAQNYATAKNKYREALQISSADITNINAKIADCDKKVADIQAEGSGKKVKKAEKLCKSDNYGQECYDYLKQNNLLYSIDPQILLKVGQFFETKDPAKSRECLNIANSRKE